jgi:hypothetical protein
MAKKATKQAAPKRKRARVLGGKFRADDPSTADINEAFVDATVSVEGVATITPKKRGRKPKPQEPPRTRKVNEFGDIVKL